MNFYTSDLHFSHANIIKHSNRPFLNVNIMNDTLIANWNRKVSKNDNIYILGDVAFTKNKEQIDEVISIIKRLNGNKYLITGNHDWKLLSDDRFVREFKKISPYMEIVDSGRKIVMFHYPIEEWNGFYRDSVHLYGHVHNNESNLSNIKNRYNVGIDVNNYEPVTLDEIINNPKNKKDI